MKETTCAAIDLGDVAQTTWDAIVVGAGPAGALAARSAALWGLRTLLVESKSVPRTKVCGGYLNSRAMDVLRKTKLELSGTFCSMAPVDELELIVGRNKARLPLPIGCVICRSEFDAWLVASAVSAGAVLVTSTQATVEPVIRDSMRCVVLAGNGRRAVICGRVVVCADGLARSSLRRFADFAATTATGSRVGIGAIVENESGMCSLGQIKMIVGREGYVGMSRSRPDQLNVASAVDANILSRIPPAQIVGNVLTRAGIAQPPGLLAADWRGTPPLTSRPKNVTMERIFLIGDSSGYVEPFTGEGLATALETGVAVTHLVAMAAKNWVPSLAPCWDALHREIVRDRQHTCRHLAWVLRRPWATHAALGICRLVPSLARQLIYKTSAPTNTYLAPWIGTL